MIRFLDDVLFSDLKFHTKANNAKGDGYNPYRDTKGRFDDGLTVTVLPKMKKRDKLKELEAPLRRDLTETFYALDPTGEVLFKAQGDRDTVVLPQEALDLLSENKGAVITHNHPNQSSFSVNDITVAASNEVSEARIVSALYDYTLKPKTTWPDKNAIIDAYSEADKKVVADFEERMANGTMTVSEANDSHYHSVVEIVAQKLNLDYKRVSND